MSASLAASLSPEPKYVSYAAHLRRQIETGELKPGDRLPSRAETRVLHQITQPTIERAQALLEREGLIVRRERQGIFVAESPARSGGGDRRGASRVVSQTVAVLTSNDGQITPGHRLPGWSDYITQGALAACAGCGKHALIVNQDRLQGEELDHLLDQPPVGFVFASILTAAQFDAVGHLVRRLSRNGIPYVAFGSEGQFASADRVHPDHEQGTYELTWYLIERGCRRILPFWPPIGEGLDWLRARHAGYLRAMVEADLEALPICEVPLLKPPSESDDTLEKFMGSARYRAGYLAEYVSGTQKIDAILEVSDGNCLATARALQLLGLEPNRDVLIAGYDNIWRDAPEMAFFPVPPVATVDKNNWEIGNSLVRLLLRRANGELPAAPQIHFVSPRMMTLQEQASGLGTSGDAGDGHRRLAHQGLLSI